MTFDPFGDFETRGYLRNFESEKDLGKIKFIEHASFLAKLDTALANLSRVARLSYRDILDTHKTLFKDVYPWAGQDRAQTAPNIAVSKGTVLFAHPDDAKPAVEHALRMGQDKAVMADKPGEIMGYLAYGHPFLDGNGRTILTAHVVLAERAGISIDWAATDKKDYLAALTRELNHPGKGHLDAYLKPFVGSALGRERLSGHIARAPGLGGNSREPESGNEVLGTFNDPALQDRYRHQQRQRGEGAGLLPRSKNGDKPPKGRGGGRSGGRS